MSAPNKLISSSGDLIADRRYELARDLAGRGDPQAAADLLVQALERAPGFVSAWFALGEMRERTGDREGAVAAFRMAVAGDADDRHGAALRLARLGVENARPMSPAYVRALFDQYAPGFDRALTDGLGYCGPQVLRRAIETLRGGDARFRRTIDLGCGTGLAGEIFRPLSGILVGVDLSPAMVEMARRKAIYDRLVVADMTAFLGNEAEPADLLIAADAFVYLEDLGPVCSAATGALAPGGLIAFTVETHAGEGVVLGDRLRYAHGKNCVRAALAANGLALRLLDPVSTRTENALPVPGLCALAEREA
jgi:predicted TPR repeat methyltransferase